MNGERCDDLARRVAPGRDRVAVDGEAARPLRAATIVFNKPPGVVVTMFDPEGRPTIVDLLQRAPDGVLPVGRLDRDSEGLLILTTDGDLAHRLAHPRFGIERTYLVAVRGDATSERLRTLAEGVLLREGRTAPARVRVERRSGSGALLRITLREGRNREVRRMCGVVGLDVLRLVRVAFGPIALGDLRPGAWRRLAEPELARLRRAAGLDAGGPRKAAP